MQHCWNRKLRQSLSKVLRLCKKADRQADQTDKRTRWADRTECLFIRRLVAKQYSGQGAETGDRVNLSKQERAGGLARQTLKIIF